MCGTRWGVVLGVSVLNVIAGRVGVRITFTEVPIGSKSTAFRAA
jgi:hypothetical protein